jgi:hypothetical protein
MQTQETEMAVGIAMAVVTTETAVIMATAETIATRARKWEIR